MAALYVNPKRAHESYVILILLFSFPVLSLPFMFQAGRTHSSTTRLYNWLQDIFNQRPHSNSYSPHKKEKKRGDRIFVFNEEDNYSKQTSTCTASTPSYVLSAFLSGLNTLPTEKSLQGGSQMGRRVQYKSYRKISLNWEVFQDTPDFIYSQSAPIDRFMESFSLSSNTDIFEQGTLRVYKFRLKEGDVKDINKDILHRVKGMMESGEEGIDVSNSGGFHSETNLFSGGENAQLASLCKLAVTQAEDHDRLHGKGRKRVLQQIDEAEAWLNVNTHGCWNSLHTHFGSAWSGIYYVQVPTDEVSSKPYCGKLLVKPSPHLSEIRPLTNEETRRLGVQTEITSGQTLTCCDFIEIKPQEGTMIIFPSFLQHAVLPLYIQSQYRGSEQGKRVSVAFNFAEI